MADLVYEFPSEWQDDKAVYPLFQAFKRPRAVDPAAFDRKMKFWSDLLTKFCERNRIVVLCPQDLRQLFRRRFESVNEEHEPQCLGAVLYSLQQSGHVIAAPDEQPRSLVGRLATSTFDLFVKRPISWTWRSLAGAESAPAAGGAAAAAAAVPSVADDCELVHAGSLSQIVRELFRRLNSDSACESPPKFAPSLNVCRRRDFDAVLGAVCPHERSRQLVLRHLLAARLLRLQSVGVGKSGQEELVVWAAADDCPLTDEQAVQADVKAANSVLHLVRAIQALEAEDQQLKRKVEQSRAECRKLLQAQRKEQAMNVMRRAKVTEKVMDERRQHLANLEKMLIQVQTVGNNQQVVEAFKVARDWVRTAKVADAHESVYDALGEIHDALADQKEVADALAFNPAADGLDEAELEHELDELLAEDSKAPPASDLDAQFSELDVDNLRLPDVADLPLPDSPSRSITELRQQLGAV